MDITPAIFDPELGCTAFTVDRITYTRSRSGMTSRTVTSQAQGCIHPGTSEMLQLLPEEEREEQFIAIYGCPFHYTDTGRPCCSAVPHGQLLSDPFHAAGTSSWANHSFISLSSISSSK